MQSQLKTEPMSHIDHFGIERENLLKKIGRLSACDFLQKGTVLIDEYFKNSYAQSGVGLEMDIRRNPFAFVALGGYGRAEQCVHSDIDILFLFEKKVPAEAEALVREIIYPFWDVKIEVGHSTRSIKECVDMAKNDYEILTSLLDGRYICGISPLYNRLMERLRIKFINSKRDKIISWLKEKNHIRHIRFGDSSYLLEPNLKEGQGGLRDYHTMLWIAKIIYDIKQPRDLEYFGCLSCDEYQILIKSLEYIWNVRNRLHLLMNRKYDQLPLENQAALAESMEVMGPSGHLPVEKMMGELHVNMETIKQCYEMFIYGIDQKRYGKRKSKDSIESVVKGLELQNGTIHFTSPEVILKDPELLVKIFLESSEQKVPLSVEARRLVKDFGYLISRNNFRSSKSVVNIFEKIMSRPDGKVDPLDTMFETGFLTEFIPEFKEVVDRIQFDQYHLYPVARHLLLTLHQVKIIGMDKSSGNYALGHRVYQEIRNKKALFWAALLHDIGKADPEKGHSERGAVITEKILREKALPEDNIDTAVFLVREHLLLFQNATGRDINDEETALNVARRVIKIERLKMLYILSMADAIATGPKAWNEWNGSLLTSLFLKTLNVMKKGELVTNRAIRTIEQKKDFILTSVHNQTDRLLYQKLMPFMSPRYLLYTPSCEIPLHIDLYRKLEKRDFIWNIQSSRKSNTRTVTICAKDRPGLLSKIAGTFTLNNINILDVRIFTWRNNIALDIFEVGAPPDRLFENERWDKTKDLLEASLDGTVDLGLELRKKQDGFRSMRPLSKARPQKLVIDNASSSFFTIVEVTAWDYPGLLFRITDALFRCQLDIWVAKIATKVDQVLDVFYVRSFDGEKMDRPEQEDAIRQAVETVFI
ncbi:MAG: [protein-PII] uridylyltransferase [Deltaproteobacteria bacterium]|nr:[protein-PII] uridylyltransferase [Deltaproteobacteria bacterium]